MASDLELSPAAVERGAKALFENAEREQPWNLASRKVKAFYVAAAEIVLTAVLRLDDPETRTRLVAACKPWATGRAGDGHLSSYTRTADEIADAVISALLGAEPEEAEDGK